MHADLASLFSSPSFRVLDFKCRMEPEATSHAEYSRFFDVSFTRQGQFGHHVGHHHWDIDSRHILLNNAGSEHYASHGRHVCDECTVVQVSERLLEEAQRTYWKKDRAAKRPAGEARRHLFPRPVIASTPALDYLHRHALARAAQGEYAGATLAMDEVLVRLVEMVYEACYGALDPEPPIADPKLRDRHLETVERARQHMLAHFQEDLSLDEIASAAFVSPFHFSRLFKRLTGNSPHQYLVQLRLNHAALLLRNTSASVTETCFASGFNSLSHFSETFARHFDASPSQFRCR